MPPAGRSYRPDTLPPARAVERHFRTQAAALAGAGVDLLLAETLGSVEEAEAALRAGAEIGVPVVVSFALDERGHVRSGPSLGAALDWIEADVVLVNCSTPAAIDRALTPEVLGRGVALGAYPNAFAPVPDGYSYAEHGPMPLDPAFGTSSFVAACAGWVRRGCRIVGGCCGVGPDAIAALAAHLAEGSIAEGRGTDGARA